MLYTRYLGPRLIPVYTLSYLIAFPSLVSLHSISDCSLLVVNRWVPIELNF